MFEAIVVSVASIRNRGKYYLLQHTRGYGSTQSSVEPHLAVHSYLDMCRSVCMCMCVCVYVEHV